MERTNNKIVTPWKWRFCNFLGYNNKTSVMFYNNQSIESTERDENNKSSYFINLIFTNNKMNYYKNVETDKMSHFKSP